MGKVNYNQWIDGNDCCGRISNCGCNSNIDKCDCDSILLDISKLYTNDEILQDEIDELSGEVETKLDTSAYTPVDLSDYYTKEQVDELIPTVPSLSGYATQDWVEQQGYLTTVEPLKTINGETLIGEGDIIISGGSIDAYTKTEADNRFQPIGDYLSGNALNGYATIAVLEQNILNLQEQINSLINSISGCCGSSGETQYRWITETGANDYWCSGTTKMSKEKQQSSTDGINWTDTGAERSGSTVLEENCEDCGYTGETMLSSVMNHYTASTSPTKIANLCSSNVIEVHISSRPHPIVYYGCKTSVDYALTANNTVHFYRNNTSIASNEYSNTDAMRFALSSEITSIGDYAFANNSKLNGVSIGDYSALDSTSQDPTCNLTSIGNYAFSGCSGLTFLAISHSNQVPTLGTGAFDGCSNLSTIYVKSSMVNAFKTASGWSTYADIIVGI